MAHLTLERIAAIKPLPDFYDRKIEDVIPELNAAIEGAGIEFGENSFSSHSYREPGAKFSEFRWIEVSAVRGGNEGYYVHIRIIPSKPDDKREQLISTAKTWTWASALEISAAATRLLCDY
jgi:hypothetical protein